MTANAEFEVRDVTPLPLEGERGVTRTDRPVLEIEDLSISYYSEGGEVKAVRHVNLALHPAEVVGLAGESGCGKSTLAYGSVRLLRPPAVITGGQVTYRGRRVAGGGVEVLSASHEQLRALRWREIAIVFQSAMNGLNPVLRIRDQLLDALGAHLHLRAGEQLDRAAELLDLVGIPRARLGSYPHELSGGMRQRVMIAMALAAEPEVVIMDEPTTGLDVVVQREILAQIFELKDRLGFSVLFITHDLSLLLEIADRIMIMYAGRLVEEGSTEQIRTGAAHPYTRGLLGSFPRLRGPRHQLLGIPGSPPDLRGDSRGCPFIPRCKFATGACNGVDMRLVRLERSEPPHLTACPFVTADRPDPGPRVGAVAALPVRDAQPVSNGRDAGASATQPPTDAPALEAVGLSKDYRIGRHATLSAVKDVSLSLHRGKVVALVGESGSGKTTVARLLAGQERRRAGTVRLDGVEIEPTARRTFRSYKNQVQMVFQDPFSSLNPVHTVRYHLERALSVHSAAGGVAGAQGEGVSDVDALLAEVRLTPPEKFRDAYPHELSGGQRQRISIARALAASPKVLLADEPVSMLDVSIRLGILDLIDDLRRRMSLAVLYITHDIASARYFADEILVMYAGEIVERGPAEQVTQEPTHPYTQLLIASAPDPDAFGKGLTRPARPAPQRVSPKNDGEVEA